MSIESLKYLLSVLFLVSPVFTLAAWTFFIFPNVDGLAKNISWYRYDENSQHFIFWAGFWTLSFFNGNAMAIHSLSRRLSEGLTR